MDIVKYRAAHFYKGFTDPITAEPRIGEKTVYYGQTLHTEDGDDTQTDVYGVPEAELNRLRKSGMLMTSQEADAYENPPGENAVASEIVTESGAVIRGDVEPPPFHEMAHWQIEDYLRTAEPTPDEILAHIKDTPPEHQEEVAHKFLNAENVVTAGEPREELLPGVVALLGTAATETAGDSTTTKDDGGQAETPPPPGGSGAEPTEAAVALATENNVDLSKVTGTGSGGRVTQADVKQYLESQGV